MKSTIALMLISVSILVAGVSVILGETYIEKPQVHRGSGR